jgi:hypothetical protein
MTARDWLEYAYFETPEPESVDGGTTSSGMLWHGVSPRWGHSMQTMCSYQGMFPAKVAHFFIQRYSGPGAVVLDPFSGRGTVPLQARAEGRVAICNDLNPLAYVLSGSKVAPPAWTAVLLFLDELENSYKATPPAGEPFVPDDIRMLFHPNTLHQVCFLRDRLLLKEITDWSAPELMIAGALAGILHGANRLDGSSQYLSISMPNTFSMAPSYVAKFIEEKGLVAPNQNVFERLRDKLARLYLDDIGGIDGAAHHQDAITLLEGMQSNSIDLLVTSPPYLRVVNYGTANWIRLWLLGLDEVGRDRGAGRKKLDAQLDHRHTYSSYAQFMRRVLQGTRHVLKPHGVAVFVIGDVADPGQDPLPLAKQIWDDTGASTGLRLIEIVEDHLPVQNKVSRIWGETKGQATARDCALVLCRDDGDPFINPEDPDWRELYKDGGPDAAHARVKATRSG